jgi:hypothetical protein
MLSFGRAEPFQVRVFSTLNSPGPFGNYMALLMLLSLPELTPKRPLLTAQFILWLVAFGLSLDRSGWVMFMLGAALYLVGTGKLQRLVAIGAVFAAAFVLVPALLPDNPITVNISDRLGTLTDLGHDESVSDRQDLYDQSVKEVLSTPAGMGLGLTGIATKLGNDTDYIDSGVLARLMEMGVFGAGLMAAALIMTISFSWKMYTRARSVRADQIVNTALVSLAMQWSLILLELSGDAHGGLLGLMMWLTVGLLSTSTLAEHAPMRVVNGRMKPVLQPSSELG